MLGNSINIKNYETFVNEKYTEFFTNHKPVGVNDAWNKVTTCLLNGVENVRSWTCGSRV